MQLDFFTTGPTGLLTIDPVYRWAPLPTGRQLRPYQEDAVTETLRLLADGAHPCLMLPTGSGKSLCIAALIQRLPQDARILVVTHRQELVEQDSDELAAFVDDQTALDYGIYAAGLARRDLTGRVIFGGLQSVYRQMDRLQNAGAFTHILIDEAHRCPPTDTPSMYQRIFDACADAQRVGLTATPYRLDSGPIYGGDLNWFDALAYELGMRALTPEYLSPLKGLLTAHNINLAGVRTKAGEYVTSDLEQAASEEALIRGALDDLCTLGADRKSWMIFCVSVNHARLVTAMLRERGISAECVLGTTEQDTRKALVEGFRAGAYRAFVNCEVGTTGFNIPQVDLVGLFYSTKSKAKLVQTLGRGSRKAPGKCDCVILDWGNNIERHRPLDDTLCSITKAGEGDGEAPLCGGGPRRLHHARQASDIDPMSDGTESGEATTYPVESVTYEVKRASRDPSKTMVVVRYQTPRRTITQYLCVEHPGFAREQARSWFARRGVEMPATAQAALTLAQHARDPIAIVAHQAKGWDRVLLEHFDQSILTPTPTDGQGDE